MVCNMAKRYKYPLKDKTDIAEYQDNVRRHRQESEKRFGDTFAQMCNAEAKTIQILTTKIGELGSSVFDAHTNKTLFSDATISDDMIELAIQINSLRTFIFDLSLCIEQRNYNETFAHNRN
jgi:hypothetical protein